MTLDIYAEEIIDRFKSPHNFGTIADADYEAEEFNPLCGDKIKIQLKTENLQLVAKFSGQGCAISQASADILCDNIHGKKLSELKALTDDFVLSIIGVSISGARLKCALLGLRALRGALNGA